MIRPTWPREEAWQICLQDRVERAIEPVVAWHGQGESRGPLERWGPFEYRRSWRLGEVPLAFHCDLRGVRHRRRKRPWLVFSEHEGHDATNHLLEGAIGCALRTSVPGTLPGLEVVRRGRLDRLRSFLRRGPAAAPGDRARTGDEDFDQEFAIRGAPRAASLVVPAVRSALRDLSHTRPALVVRGAVAEFSWRMDYGLGASRVGLSRDGTSLTSGFYWLEKVLAFTLSRAVPALLALEERP